MNSSSMASSSAIGDWMLTFGVERCKFPARSNDAAWQPGATDLGWQVWSHACAKSWKGFPCYYDRFQDWQFWFLGDIRGSDPQNFLAQNPLQDAIPKLNGQFIVFAWHETRQCWHAWTDRFATLHAYYAWDSRRVALGTFFPAVARAASNRQFDWAGLAGFFSMGFFPNDLTYYQDVKILAPASHYVFSADGRLSLSERYWDWWHEPSDNRSYDQTVEQFSAIFSQVMAEATHSGRNALPISGGLDSRSTVAALTSFRETPTERFWAYSYGYSDDSVETDIASRVAEARGLPIRTFTIRPYLFDQIERVSAWTEGFVDITQPRQAFVRDQIAAQADALVAALWGDVWLDDMGLIDRTSVALDDQAIAEQTLAKMLKGGHEWLLVNLVRPNLPYKNFNGLLREMVASELSSLNNIEDLDFRVKAYKTEQWSFRWSLPPIRVFQSAARPRLIFYDTRLTDFFSTVPSKFLTGRRLQIDYLKRIAPDLARITWQVYDADLYSYQRFNSWQLPKRAIKKSRRILRRQKVIERNWEMQFLNADGRLGLQRWLLEPGLRLHELVNCSTIETLLSNFYTVPSPASGYTVSMLLTFSAWLETQH